MDADQDRPQDDESSQGDIEASPELHGPYKRIYSSSQPDELAIIMRDSRELWGKASRLNGLPAVKAYTGALQPDEYGVEFLTPVKPHDDDAPTGRRFWYLEDAGCRVVDEDDDYVKIPIIVTHYRLRKR